MAKLTCRGSSLTAEVFTGSYSTLFSSAAPVSAGVALVLDYEVQFVFAKYLSFMSVFSSGMCYDDDIGTRHRLNFLQPSGGK